MQYVIFGIILIAFAVLVIKSYAKKLAAGCCGAVSYTHLTLPTNSRV